MRSTTFPRPLVDATLFYLATWDGTGAVERGLGQDAAIQKQHAGWRAQEYQDADLHSGLMKMHLDGPQTEETMFTSRDGVLLLTDFSRSCAQQWLCQHGRSRRFGIRLRRVQPPAGTSSASTPGPSMYNALASKLAKKQVQYDRWPTRRDGFRCFDGSRCFDARNTRGSGSSPQPHRRGVPRSSQLHDERAR